MGSPPLATTATAGLMSANDKQVLDNLNPNVSVTYSDVNSSTMAIMNAKQENLIDLLINEEPHILAQIRTNNLLNVNDEEVTDGYLSSSGVLTASTNNNDYAGPFIPVTAGQDIYYTGIVGETTSSSINRRLHVYNANKQWIKQLSFAGSLRIGDHWSTHGTIPSNGAYVRVSWGITDYNVMISVGAPSEYKPYYLTPFEEITTASFQLASNSDMTGAITYTTVVPNTITDAYGFQYNPILGKIYLTTGHIDSYNGETLPGYWWSDRDIYEENTSPTTGAEVIYMLANEDIEEYNITPLTIPMFYQKNYFVIDNGEIINISYYAETLAAKHFTVYDGVKFGTTNIDETNVIGWNHAADEIDLKANIDSPIFTGIPQAPTANINVNSDRLATTAFVQQKMNNIASLEPSSRASKNYSVGDYLFMGGQLFKVTAPIVQNGTITAGTNVEAATVMDEIQNLDDVFVHVTNQGNNNYTSDKTYDEILAAIQRGQTVFAKMDGEGGNYLLIEVESSYVIFKKSCKLGSTSVSRDGNVIPCLYEHIITIYKSGTVNFYITSFTNSNLYYNEIIEIVDGNGDYFESADDLTTANASSIGINFPGWEIWEWPIFWENSKVRVGTMTESNISDGWYSDTSRSCELYDCVKTEITKNIITDPQGYEDPYTMITHTGTFRTLSMRNGNPVIKTIIITAYHQEYTDIDYSNDISVTYSEIAL